MEKNEVDQLIDSLLGFDRRALQQDLNEGFDKWVCRHRRRRNIASCTLSLLLFVACIGMACSPHHYILSNDSNATYASVAADTHNMLCHS